MFYAGYGSELIGELILLSDGEALVGCWFENSRYFGCGTDGSAPERCDNLPIFDAARAWLDDYFAGKRPNPRTLPFAKNVSEFRLLVREAMLDIPYGQTATYGAIAARVALQTGRRPCAQAVGGAVGHNPLGIIVPCHRVIGTNGSLTGFGGGLDKKIALLELEGVDTSALKRPTRGSAIAGVEHASQDFLARGLR